MGAGRDGDEPLLPLGLTMGDPAGIGPEITLRAWLARDTSRVPPFLVYADAGMLAARARAFGLAVPVQTIPDASAAPRVFDDALPVLSGPLHVTAEAGKADAAHAPAVLRAIDTAVADAARGHIRAVVTNPIAKSVLYAGGFKHPGHTEYLAELAGQHWPSLPHQPVMMLVSGALKVVPLTIHVPLKDVPRLITRQLIVETVRITAAALQHDFGIGAPRIAVAGLNPHAGEDGALGDEDRDVIQPAILDLQRLGFSITGPRSADTLFHAGARKTYDAVIAMYHDQALIPIKTLAFDEGVNVTLGLPFVRTSPDHGTAFDIAAKGGASPVSLIEAIKLAGAIAARREMTRT